MIYRYKESKRSYSAIGSRIGEGIKQYQKTNLDANLAELYALSLVRIGFSGNHNSEEIFPGMVGAEKAIIA